MTTENVVPSSTSLVMATPKTKKRWVAVGSLAAASFVDKVEDNAVSILWPGMYPALGLTVGQLGPVLGVSRLVMTLMLPIWGYAADSVSRKKLLVWRSYPFTWEGCRGKNISQKSEKQKRKGINKVTDNKIKLRLAEQALSLMAV
jgi:hypothetical protein